MARTFEPNGNSPRELAGCVIGARAAKGGAASVATLKREGAQGGGGGGGLTALERREATQFLLNRPEPMSGVAWWCCQGRNRRGYPVIMITPSR
jgi:hypothetical protein